MGTERNESMARSQSSGHSGLSGRRAQKQQSSGVFIFVAFAVCAAIFLLSQGPSPTSPPAIDPSAQTAADLWLMSVAAAVTLIAMVFLFRSKEPSDEDIEETMRATARAIYEAADINEDGHLSHKELINYIEDDKNAENGELREALEARNPGFFKNMDGNSDGVLTLQEFEDYYVKQIK